MKKKSTLILFCLFLSFANTTFAGDSSHSWMETDNGEQDCTTRIEQATLRLMDMAGCTKQQISYELPDGTNVNPYAPANKSCHIFDPAGAGETPCGPYLSTRKDTDGSMSKNSEAQTENTED